MPKRKNENKEDKEEEGNVAAILHERWDVDVLTSINQLVLNPSIDANISAIASEFATSLSNPSPQSRRSVSYSATTDFKEGRVYGQGLQGVSGWIRRLCSYKYYHDLDIANCAPTLLYQVIEKLFGECPAMIKEYAIDRAKMFMTLREQEPELKNIPEKKLKEIFRSSAYTVVNM